ncbi:MAG: ATP-dependent zinc protease [Gammaproteobacteria bacterium]|nr:ATP-dependent zinc protease [Gammaproteobacteria bacterium]
MRSVVLRLLANLCALAVPCVRADLPDRVGWVEMARINPGKMLFVAKLDTGSKSSSINAHNIEYFEKDGQPWVRFDVINRLKRTLTLELPQVRDVIIKRHEGEKEERPVVMLGICLGKVYAETPVSLVDRTGFLYPLLVGRSYLAGNFAVETARKFTTSPECEETRRP